MNYCDETDLNIYLLSGYLKKIEEINPGSTARHIEQVSAEIDEALRANYELPLESAPATLRRICAVIAAWRLVGEITTLMETDASNANEWLPLQTLYRQALKDLEAIRAGRPGYGLDVGAPEAGGVDVSTSERLFTDEVWRKF